MIRNQFSSKERIFGLILPVPTGIIFILAGILLSNVKWVFIRLGIVILMAEIAFILLKLITPKIQASSRSSGDDYARPRGVISNLLTMTSSLFGREEELKMLDAAWGTPEAGSNANIVSVVGWGGVGKTALVKKWVTQLGTAEKSGAEHVYIYSFYGQGVAGSKQVSADPFIADALERFGDPKPAEGSVWDKGKRLADLVREQRTLFILDGLEPLQYPSGEAAGKLKSPCLRILLTELARHNPGLCVITSRLNVRDIEAFVGASVKRISLGKLSNKAGVDFLRHLEIKGKSEKLEEAVVEFGGHALALNLLGSFLKENHGGDIRYWDLIGRLEEPEEKGGQIRRVLDSYEKWLSERPELDIMRLIGMFDRPAEAGALAVLTADPIIYGLTDNLFYELKRFSLWTLLYYDRPRPIDGQDWLQAVERLHQTRLLLEAPPKYLGAIDAHPLVREHFGKKLRRNNPGAWREAHSRLYEYCKSLPEKDQPDTFDEMAPLYAAVAHGCQAGRHTEVFDEVYWRRICREGEYYSSKKLGALDATLTALSCFFDSPWHKLADGFTEANRAVILNEAGFCLRGLGRLAEAVEPMQAGLKIRIAQENWRNAAISAGNLSELHLTMGELKEALDYVRHSVEYVDRIGEASQQRIRRARLAYVLHQAGKFEEAKAVFREAETMQRELQPKYPFLYSVSGFQYCDLLLQYGEYQDVLDRAGQTLKWAQQAGLSQLTLALDNCSLGRAYLLQAQVEGNDDFSQAGAHLDQAVDGLKQTGEQEFVVCGLLARAELRRVMEKFEKAQQDLYQAMTIATWGGIRLHEADCHLESARLHLSMGDKNSAQESMNKAKKMLDEMGYHRRDGEVKELEEKLMGA